MEYVDNQSYFQTIWAPVASVGWYIVGLVVIVFYAFSYIQTRYESWKLAKNQNGTSQSKKTDQSPEMMANVEFARQRMQEVYNQKCVLAQLKEEEVKEKKKQKVVKILENVDVGKRLGRATDKETPGTSPKSKSLKSEYSPLMGDSTRGYRPPKRSCCGKGGCG